MASIIDDPGGCKRILFVLNGKRRPVRLGKITSKQAETFKLRIEQLVEAAQLGQSLNGELTRWLSELDSKIRGRMERAGLVRTSAGAHVTLEHLIEKVTATTKVKESTGLVHGHAKRNLRDYFGKGKIIREIGPLQADEWREWLSEHEGLAGPTISKRVKIARMIFRKAVKWKMVDENPFAEVKTGPQTNSARQYFLSPEDAQKVLDACPDAQWRLLFALSRYGGLRCPSEHLLLRWCDVDWDKGRLLITSPKTEHHDGGDSRLMPIFPELRPYLMEVLEETG